MEAKPSAQPPTFTWETLEKSLAHPNAVIREKAIESAGRFGDARTLAALQSAVRDENPRIRTAAAQAFVAAIGRNHPEIDAALARLVTTAADEELRRFLISISAASNSTAVLRAVIETLVNPSPALRFAAEAALNERGDAWLFTISASDASAVIQAACQSSQTEVTQAARNWSEKLQRAQVRRTMLDSGVATILTLTAALRSKSAVLRGSAAWALSQSGDQRAVPGLMDALRDPDETVRRTAAVSLAQLQWGAATEEELAEQLVALGRWADAVQRGAAAVDALLLAATSSAPATQVRAIEALAELKSVRALLPLQKLLKSEHAMVRRAAAIALKSLEWVPATDEHAVTHAVEMEDWTGAAATGAASVEALLHALKDSHGQPERAARITEAMAGIKDPNAAPRLVSACRDGEVAATAVRALEQLLEQAASEISEHVLNEVLALNNVVQFQFAVDPQFPRPVRSGLVFVNVDALRERAAAELARRSTTKSAEVS